MEVSREDGNDLALIVHMDGTDEDCARFVRVYREGLRRMGVAVPGERWVAALYRERCASAA